MSIFLLKNLFKSPLINPNNQLYILNQYLNMYNRNFSILIYFKLILKLKYVKILSSQISALNSIY